jgi:hypothetical protein
MVVYRAADTPAGKMVDSIRGVKIVVGEDTAQDVDMSRQEYIDKMTPEEKEAAGGLKKANAEALKANVLINQLNADLKIVNRTRKTSTTQPPLATQASGRQRFQGRSCQQDRRDQDRQVHRYREPLRPRIRPQAGRGLVVEQLGYGQAGLKQYDDAITAYKKASISRPPPKSRAGP